MSKKRSTSIVNNYFSAALLLLTLTFTSPITAFETVDISCTEKESMPLNSSIWSSGSHTGELSFFQAEVTEPGLLTLDIAVSGSTEIEAKLGLFERACSQAKLTEVDFTILDRTPTGLVVWIHTPGTLTFAVAAQDPVEPLGEFRLTAGFAAEADAYWSTDGFPIRKNNGENVESDDEIEIEPNLKYDDLPFNKNDETQVESDDEIEIEPNFEGEEPLKKSTHEDVESDDEIEIEPNFEGEEPLKKSTHEDVESDDEIEIEPNLRYDDLPFHKNDETHVESDDEIEIEPNFEGEEPLKKSTHEDVESDDEIEIEPNSKRVASHGPWPDEDELQSTMRQLCRQLEGDDHADTPMCATAILAGEKITGSLAGSWYSDHDLFVFTLLEPTTVYLMTIGSTDTLGLLSDSYGHRLAVADEGGELDNFRMVKTLAPGLYYLRVEGAFGAEGSYTLQFETRSW